MAKHCFLLAFLGLCALAAPAGAQPTIVNGDFEFEADMFSNCPGYYGNTFNFPSTNPTDIFGWTHTLTGGLDPGSQSCNPDDTFRDNGDHHANAAFIQIRGTLSQDIHHLVVGTNYQVDFDYDARAGNGRDGAIPSLTVSIGDLGAVLVDPKVTAVDPKGVHVTPWHHGQFTFTADANPMTLTFSCETPNNADGALLLGNIVLSEASPLERPIEDDFAGVFNSSIPWRWDVPGNNPNDTKDPTHYAFSSNSLDITAQPGTLFAANNNAHNIPNLLILGKPDYWFVETEVSTDWSMASLDRFVHAGLVFLADADNYFSFYYDRDAASSPSVNVSTTFELAGNPRFGGLSSAPWSPTPDYVKLRVQGTPTDVSFLFNRTGSWQLANGGRISSTNQPDVYALLSSLVGKRIGLETDTGGGFNTGPFHFGYFKTNLVLSQ